MKLYITLAAIFTLAFASCSDNSVTYEEGGDAEYTVEYAIIDPSAWQPVALEDPYSWIVSHFIKSPVSNRIGENGAVFCYYRTTTNGTWQMMPSTAVYWTDDGTVYSEEYWFAYDNDYVDFYYRYTEPEVDSRPVSRIEVKIVFLEGELLQRLEVNNELNPKNHDIFMESLKYSSLRKLEDKKSLE